MRMAARSEEEASVDLSTGRRGSLSLGGAALILGAVFVGAIAMTAFGAHIVMRNLSFSSRNVAGSKEVSIGMPGAKLELRTGEGSDAGIPGVPVYPGARRQKQASASITWTSGDEPGDKPGVAVGGGEFVSADSPDKVLAWYRQRLPQWKDADGHDGDAGGLESHEDGRKRMITVRAKEDGTHIGVATVNEAASN